MSRGRVRRLADEFALSGAELDYLAEVDRELARVPMVPRRQMLTETAEMLSERPPAVAPPELIEALGEPATYVDTWRAAEGFDRGVPPWRRWWLLPTWLRLAPLGIVLAVVVASAVAWRYHDDDAEIVNSCSGVHASEWERLRAGGASELRVAFHQDERLGVSLCPFTLDPGVTFERVYVRLGSGSSIQPVGWEVSTGETIEWTGDASRNRPWTMDEVAGGWAHVMLWFEMAFCIQEGAVTSFDTVSVDYRYRGRARTADVPVNETVSIVGTAECTDERPEVVRQERRFSEVVDGRLFPRSTPIEPLGPYGLEPREVSFDLCRYLGGVIPVGGYDQFEPLEARAVFQLDDEALAAILIDGAVLGVCPEFADRRDELVELLGS